MLNITQKYISSIVVMVTLLLVTTYSQAVTLTFEKITTNNNVDLTDQLSVDVNDAGGGSVGFTFYNNVGLDSSLTDIYFDLGLAEGEVLSNSTLFSSFQIADDSDTLAVTTDVYFEPEATPVTLPAGNPINFTSNYDADAPTPKQGLDQGGEWVTFLATLGSNYTYDNVLAALLDGSLRIGLHIQSIADACINGEDCANDSSSYVNVVPVPAAAWLFGTALFGLFATSRRRKNSI